MKLETLIKCLTKEILSYESDTFSASGAKLSEARAEAIVVKLIQQNVIPGENIDGHEISEAYRSTRNPR